MNLRINDYSLPHGLRDHLLASLCGETQACAKGALEEAAS
jgi:hypothetical protein